MSPWYKNLRDQMLTGVIGGVAARLHWDPILLRMLFILVVVVSGFFPGVLAYLITATILPRRDRIDQGQPGSSVR